MMRRRVDLPQPDGPRSVRNSPALIDSETSPSTDTGPNALEIATKSTAAADPCKDRDCVGIDAIKRFLISHWMRLLLLQ